MQATQKEETPEKESDQTMRKFNGNVLTTAYKSKIIRFKMDEDPLQRRIYFLTFVESLEIIFSQYKETCEILLDYPKIGGDDNIEDYAKKAIRNLLHANIDVRTEQTPRKCFRCGSENHIIVKMSKAIMF